MIKKDINIIPDDSLQRIHVSQGDIGRTLQFVLYEGSTSYTIPVGATVKIQGVKPSGLGFSETCTWSGSTVTIDTTEAMTQEFGGIPTEIQITDGTDVLGTSNFLLIVERNPHPDNTTDGTQDTIASLEVRIEALESAISSGGITNDIKQALLDCFEHVAWIDANGQDYYDALEDALYPPANLVSISCTYTQSGTVYDTDTLDSLKSDLVVTATYDDSSTATVTSYTLSGTLTTGTSTITVSYGGKTDTFTVTVTDITGGALYYWDLTDSLTDMVNSNVATVNGATRTNNGLSFTASNNIAVFPNVFGANRRIEIDVASINRQGSEHGRFIIYNRGSLASPSLDSGLMYRMSQSYWALYTSSWKTTSYTDATMFNGKTVVVELDSNKVMTVKVDDTTVVTSGSAINIASDDNTLYIGSNEKSLFNLVITGVRVYEVSE